MASALSMGMNTKRNPPRFDALAVSLDFIRSLALPIKAIQAHDPNLAKQLRNAASSIALNLSEGSRRTGRDRRHLFRIAEGSANESRTCLLVAVAWGCLDEPTIEPSLTLLDRVLAMLWRLTH